MKPGSGHTIWGSRMINNKKKNGFSKSKYSYYNKGGNKIILIFLFKEDNLCLNINARWIYTNFFFSYLGLPVPDEMITNQEYTVNINAGKLKLNSLKKKTGKCIVWEKCCNATELYNFVWFSINIFW